MRIQDILERLSGVTQEKEDGTGEYENIYFAECPIHNRPRGLILYESDGEIVLNCYDGCTREEICNAIGIDEIDVVSTEMVQLADPLLSCFRNMNTFNEEEASWLVDGWIPEGQITLMAADGGVGKTTLWCDIVAGISNGKPCILDKPDVIREPKKTLFLSTEDSVSKKLKKKLRLAGANMENIITLDTRIDKDGLLRHLKFGSKELERVIRAFRPALCVFDPIQGFVPPEINMGSRNAMRDCMAPLVTLGEECGTTFVVVCHSNKRKGASGRDRIADSADLWDISRSVLMLGYTEESGIRYISNEKNNYSELQKTQLFSINEEGLPQKEGTTWKRDREYIQDMAVAFSAPKREECKKFILDALDEAGGCMKTKELDEKAKAAGYGGTLKKSKTELKEANEIKYAAYGYGANKIWVTQRIGFTEVKDDQDNPFLAEPSLSEIPAYPSKSINH